MTPLYSVVIHPPQDIINKIATLKQKLKERIGNYSSCNSLAHITFNLFSGSEFTLTRWEEYITLFVKNLTPLNVCFDRTGTFHNGAFYIAPDEKTSNLLVPIMKAFPKNAPKYPYGKSAKPHISIGRQLTEEEIVIAKELIKDVHLEFICDNLTIRKFNPERGQYDVYKKFFWEGF